MTTEAWNTGKLPDGSRIVAATDSVPPAFKVSDEERNAIKEIIAGLAFICEISDTGQLVDHAFNELERRRNAGVLGTDHQSFCTDPPMVPREGEMRRE